jgi:DNA-directed RNA polymerase specialized sigma24 family protein
MRDFPGTDLERVYRREPTACRALVHALMPAIEARIWAVLSRAPAGRPTRERVAEFAQEVFVALFEDDCRVLRSWDPARGAQLRTFVGLVAERVVLGILRSGRRSAWREDPTLSEELDRVAGATAGPEVSVLDRDYLRRLLDAVQERLSPRGMELFIALYAEDQPIEVVCTRHGMTAPAVYAWRNRFKTLLSELAAQLSPERAAEGAGRPEGPT